MGNLVFFSHFNTALNALAPFESQPALAIAVSGGADSMALALLANEWARARGGEIIALSVDHGLRPESKDEAAQVSVWMAAYNIEHHILRWQHEEIPTSGILEAARDARYGLLTHWCREHDVLHLLIAHHADDQAETVVMRRAKSIVGDGLSGMSALSVRNGVRLLRPLLGFHKAQLIQYLQSQHQDWIEDPSNHNVAYTRNAVRAKMTRDESDAHLRIVKTAAKSRLQNERELARTMAKSVIIYPEGWCEWLLDASESLLHPQKISLLSACIHLVGNAKKPIRWEEAEHALDTLLGGVQIAVTLGGCYIERVMRTKKQPHCIRILREQAAIEPAMSLNEKQQTWDNRFTIHAQKITPQYRIEALGHEGFLAIKSLLSKDMLNRLPRRVFLTLPAVKALEEVVKLPHINYNNNAFEFADITVRWHPKQPLSQHPFLPAK